MSKLKLVLQKKIPKENSTQVLQRIFCQKCSWWLNQQVNETSVETNKHSKIYWAIFSKKRLKIRPPLGPSQKKGAAKNHNFLVGIWGPQKFCFQKIAQKVSEILKVYNSGDPFSLFGQKTKDTYIGNFHKKAYKIEPKNCLPPRKKNPSCT